MSTEEPIDPERAALLVPALEELERAARSFITAYVASRPADQARSLAALHAAGIAPGLAISLGGLVDVVAVDRRGQLQVLDQPRLTRATPKH